MLAETVDIRRWLREDRRTPYPERLARDRAIGREVEARREADRVLAWWRRVEPDAGPGAPGPRVEAGRRLAVVALVLLGFVAGAAIAGIAFAYDGRHPVNLFTLLGVLVGLPLIMLVLTLLLIPGRVPGLGAVQTIAAGMSPGRWVSAWLDRLLGADLFAPALLGGPSSAFSRWQLVVFSQWLAVGFFAGALTVALLLVTFTDLAFGWSTTLQFDADLIYAVVATLSAPWASWMPQAAPDAALVEASRYFRLEDARLPPERVERLGEWWPFVLMTILAYGALPRLLLLAVGSWRLRRATVALLVQDPEVTALLDRMDAPLVALGGDTGEERPESDRAAVPAPAEAAEAEGLVLLVWNGAADLDAARRWLATNLGAEPESASDAGILQSEEQRRAALEQARAGVRGRVRRVVLVTKGWEPPLLEFMDFLGLVREALARDASITVVPLDVHGTRVQAADRDVWARALARVRDPRLYVMDVTAQVSA